MARWAPRQKMLVDCVTKLEANVALNQYCKSGWLSLIDVATELERRKADLPSPQSCGVSAPSPARVREELRGADLFPCDSGQLHLFGGASKTPRWYRLTGVQPAILRACVSARSALLTFAACVVGREAARRKHYANARCFAVEVVRSSQRLGNHSDPGQVCARTTC